MSNSNSNTQQSNVYLFDGVYQVVALDKKAAADLIWEDFDIRLTTKDIQKRISFLKKV
jgi:hypothetical protein